MSIGRRAPTAFVLVLVGLLLHCCHHRPRGMIGPEEQADNSDSLRCGPALSDEQVIDVAKRALQALWGVSSLDRFTIKISEHGCDYHFFGIRKGTEAAEDIFFIIDRTQRVSSAPACLFLGDLGNCPTLGSSDE